MPVDRQKAALFAAAVAVRLFLFAAFPSLPDLLTSRVEVSTPVSSFKRCEGSGYFVQFIQWLTRSIAVQEGLFLYTRNVSPYEGGVFHQVLTIHAICESRRLF
jgi:phosphatidylinositol glycan class U